MTAKFTVLLGLFVVSIAIGQQAKQPVVQVRDGGTSGAMESIFVPPILGAPFSLTLVTEWSRPLGNGGTFTLANQRRIVRDGKGRIYQERWLLVPRGGTVKSRMDVMQFTDPAQHTWYNCYPAQKICELLPYTTTPEMVYKPAIGVTGPLPNGSGFHQHEELGVANTNGVDTTGYRETNTINAGVLGNDRPMVTSREFWYSARLGINLISKVDDPQSGRQVFTATDMTTSEPDPALLAVPSDY